MSDWSCADCGVTTWDISEYYMVEDLVWEQATGSMEGLLCVGCLEHRVGRRLVPGDFTECPLNEGFFPQSSRLMNRLTRK